MNQFSRRAMLAAGAATALAAAYPLAARAQQSSYPSRAIRLVNPFAPGGSADVVSRLFAAELGPILGATMFVDNTSGAGGTIGSQRVAAAPPDGYTLLLSNVASQSIAPSLYSTVSYDALKDFEHIALFGTFPNVLVVGPQVQAKNLQEFIEEARAKPGELMYGSAGSGSTPHLSAELFKLRTGIDIQHVPYQGAGPALLAVISGEIAFQFENLSTAIPQIRGGRLRALGVTSATRIDALPDVPTIQEGGVDDFVVSSWYGISAPKGTPGNVQDAVAAAVVTALQKPEMRQRLAEVGLQLPLVEPKDYQGFVASEIDRWSSLIKASGAKVD